jgi:hypothetical protein
VVGLKKLHALVSNNDARVIRLRRQCTKRFCQPPKEEIRKVMLIASCNVAAAGLGGMQPEKERRNAHEQDWDKEDKPFVCKDAPDSATTYYSDIPLYVHLLPISLSIQNRQRAFLTTSCTGLTPPPVQASPLHSCTRTTVFTTSCTSLSSLLLY